MASRLLHTCFTEAGESGFIAETFPSTCLPLFLLPKFHFEFGVWISPETQKEVEMEWVTVTSRFSELYLKAQLPFSRVHQGRVEVDETILEAVSSSGSYNSVFFLWDGRLIVDKREETSLVPEIKLQNKLKCSLKALLLLLHSIHVKPKTASTDFRASYRFCHWCLDWRLSLWVINVMRQSVLFGRWLIYGRWNFREMEVTPHLVHGSSKIRLHCCIL